MTGPATLFWDYREHVTFRTEGPAKVQLGSGEHSRTTLWCLGPGQEIHPHAHAGDHVWCILEGRGEFLEGDAVSSREVTAGTVLLAPAGEPHGIRAAGSGGLVFLSVSAG